MPQEPEQPIIPDDQAIQVSFDDPEWDQLTYKQKSRNMQAFLQRVGYDPEKAALENRVRKLEDQMASLNLRMQSLEGKLQQLIDLDAERIRKLGRIG